MPGATRKVGKKQKRAENKANSVARTFKKKLREGRSLGQMFLATVTEVHGGARFAVEDLNGKKHTVRLAKVLVQKAARHRDAVMKTAVHMGSHVIVDDNVIRSILGAAEFADLKKKLKGATPNSLFSHNSVKSSRSKGSKSSKGSKRSKKGKKKSPNVNLDMLGGFSSWF